MLSVAPPRQDLGITQVFRKLIRNSNGNRRHNAAFKIYAFTLAEVLITLGIIGVVAAMTMPSLIQNYQKKQTAVKLERFYSIMSQAVLRWQQDEGLVPEDIRFSSDMIRNGANTQKWFNETIGQYIQTVSQKSSNTAFTVAFNDGSGFDTYVSDTNLMHIFYCVDYKYCTGAKNSNFTEGNFNGKTGFLFGISNGKFITSNPSSENKTREELLESCKYGNYDDPSVSSAGRRHNCTRLIQVDGWEIKKDYPWNQIMIEN